MSAELERRAELLMLGRLLGRDPDQLGYLDGLDPAGLRVVRRSATDLLFDGDRAMFARLAAGSKALPTGVLAKIAERAFGPLLCARIAGYIEPGRAVEVAAKLPPEFLARVAIEIDPRKARTVIGRIPAPQAAAVAEVLTAADEFVTMGRFVGHLEDEAIAACLEVIDDDKLLPIAFVMEDKERLDHVMGMLAAERAVRVARAAADAGHWAEALDLAEHVSEEQAGRLADAVAGRDEVVLDSLVEAATANGLWPDLLPVSRAMSERGRRRFAELGAVHRTEVLEQMVAATVDQGLWRELLPLVTALPEDARGELGRIAAARPGAIEGAVGAALEYDLWPDLVALVPSLEGEAQAQISETVAALPPERQQELIAAAGERDLWGPLIAILERLGPEAQARIGASLSGADEQVVTELFAAIAESGSGERLAALRDHA